MTKTAEEVKDDKPPFFDTWSKMYGLVMIVLGILILLFYFFTQYYS